MRTKRKRIKELEEQLEAAKFVIEVLQKRNDKLKEEYDRLKDNRSS